MAILIVPILLIVIWCLFFLIFISIKASEGKTRSELVKHWLKLLFVPIGCYALGKWLFVISRTYDLLPAVIENSVLAYSGGFVGFLVGAVYVLAKSGD